MAELTVKGLPREFKFTHKGKAITLDDPNPNMTPSEVMSFYSNSYPQLTNGSVSAPEVKATKLVYTFSTTVGKKG